VLVFDGECAFCRRSLRALCDRTAWWPRFAAYQQLSDGELASLGLTREQCRQAVRWVDERGRRTSGHEVLAAWLARQPGGRARVMARGLRAPLIRGAAASGYRFVARNRAAISRLTRLTRGADTISWEADRP
jgi:predicted DCC family thiol-disulfide oxidoreductase YuxK